MRFCKFFFIVLLMAKKQAEEAQLQAEQKAQRLMEKLREMGIDPDEI